jgi:hypothetical protein
MRNLISAQMAAKISILLMGLLVLMHILILLNILSADFVWGGQLANDGSNLMELEIVAIGMLLVFIILVAAKSKLMKVPDSGLLKVSCWLIVAFYILNTAGNLAAESTTESLVFTPVTILLALLTARVALD